MSLLTDPNSLVSDESPPSALGDFFLAAFRILDFRRYLASNRGSVHPGALKHLDVGEQLPFVDPSVLPKDDPDACSCGIWYSQIAFTYACLSGLNDEWLNRLKIIPRQLHSERGVISLDVERLESLGRKLLVVSSGRINIALNKGDPEEIDPGVVFCALPGILDISLRDNVTMIVFGVLEPDTV